MRAMPWMIRHASAEAALASTSAALTSASCTRHAGFPCAARRSSPGPRLDGSNPGSPIVAAAASGTANIARSPVASSRDTDADRTYGPRSRPMWSGWSGACVNTTSSSRRRTCTSARIRPVGVNNSDRHDAPGTSPAISAVSRSCSHPTASSPWTRTFRYADTSTKARPVNSAARSCAKASWSAIPLVGHYRRVQVPPTLLVTNDFPPRIGGIQRTLEALWREPPADRAGVFCADWDDAAAYDSVAPFRVFRQPERFLWPARGVADRIEAAARDMGAEVVLFGATYPLALVGPRLASHGLPYLTAAHGFEYWLSLAPGTHTLMRRATGSATRVPVMCSAFIARTVRTAVPAQVPVTVLYPGADVERFRPDLPTDDIRSTLGLDGAPLVVCVSRLVKRKGQDRLIDALPLIRERVSDARLLIVGGGPEDERLRSRAASLSDAVVFTGQVPEDELPRYYAVGDVFAMPCRTRLGGLEVEGWGNVFIEAAACGRPVVVGDSGGARESLVDGETGILVDGRDTEAVADAVATLLADPERAAAMGTAGRERVLRDHTWPRIADKLAEWLTEAAATA